MDTNLMHFHSFQLQALLIIQVPKHRINMKKNDDTGSTQKVSQNI